MRGRPIGLVLIILPVVLIAAGALFYYRMDVVHASPPRITIVNQSDVALEDQVLEGPGYRLQLDRLPPHTRAGPVVHVMGEASPRISFKAGVQARSADDLANVENQGGYQVAITVDESLGIRSDSSLMSPW